MGRSVCDPEGHGHCSFLHPTAGHQGRVLGPQQHELGAFPGV